jgi:hypothetical protein
MRPRETNVQAFEAEADNLSSVQAFEAEADNLSSECLSF